MAQLTQQVLDAVVAQHALWFTDQSHGARAANYPGCGWRSSITLPCGGTLRLCRTPQQ